MNDFLSGAEKGNSLALSGRALQDMKAKAEAFLLQLKCLEGDSELADKEYYTVRELAKYVARSEYTVRRWIKEGLISAVRLVSGGSNGSLLVHKDELKKLFA